MTEKRFEGEEDSDYIRDNKTDERALYLCDWLNKLNNLSDENEQLKDELFDVTTSLIYETSSNIGEDIEKARKEIYGDVE